MTNTKCARRFGGLSLSFWSGKYFTLMAGQSGVDAPLPSSFTPSAVAVAGVVLGSWDGWLGKGNRSTTHSQPVSLRHCHAPDQVSGKLSVGSQ